jgi:hypothetical protein
MGIRVVPTNTLVYDQLDWFQGDFFTRIGGLVPADLAFVVFVNNTVTAWPLTSGVGVTDAQVQAGRVYFQELATGYYGVRFRPNALGYWRLDFRYAAGVQTVSLDYDVVTKLDMAATGLHASFVGRTT